MAAIDVGSAAVNGGVANKLSIGAASATVVVYSNPANGTGIITSVEAWFNTAEAGNSVTVGTFYEGPAGTFTCRDSESIGEVTAGSKQTYVVSLSVETGDYLGICAFSETVYLEATSAPGSDSFGVEGEYIDPSDSAAYASSYQLSGETQSVANMVLSLYGTGHSTYTATSAVGLGIAAAGAKSWGRERASAVGVGVAALGTRGLATFNRTSALGIGLDLFYSGWPYRIPVTLYATKAGGATQTDFVATITNNHVPDSFWSAVKSDGTDIFVLGSDGKKLKRQVAYINTVTKVMELFVRIPTYSHTVDTVVYLYYGNAAGAETNDADTWPATWVFASDMSDYNSGTQIRDWSQYGNHGTKGAGAAAPTEEAGLVGMAQQFVDGTYIDLPDLTMTTDNPASLLVMHKWDAWAGLRKGLAIQNNRFGWYYYSGDARFGVRTTVGGVDETAYAQATYTSWHVKVGVYEPPTGAGLVSAYEDGVFKSSAVTDADAGVSLAPSFRIGGKYVLGGTIDGWYRGLLCELRLSSSALGAELQTAIDHWLRNNSLCYEMGAVETYTGRRVTYYRTGPLGLGLSVAATRGFAKLASLAIGIAAAATRAVAWNRTSPLGLGVLAAATRNTVLSRTSAVGVGLTALGARAMSYSRSSALGIGFVVAVTRGFAKTAALGIGIAVRGYRDILGQILRVRLAKEDPYVVKTAPDDPYKVDITPPEE